MLNKWILWKNCSITTTTTTRRITLLLLLLHLLLLHPNPTTLSLLHQPKKYCCWWRRVNLFYDEYLLFSASLPRWDWLWISSSKKPPPLHFQILKMMIRWEGPEILKYVCNSNYNNNSECALPYHHTEQPNLFFALSSPNLLLGEHASYFFCEHLAAEKCVFFFYYQRQENWICVVCCMCV